eukprot:9489314-Pyramimonas_sp.AAC.1
MPSHLSKGAAEGRGCEPHWFRGNKEADSWATGGAKAHTANHYLRDRIHFRHDQVTFVARYSVAVPKHVHQL